MFITGLALGVAVCGPDASAKGLKTKFFPDKKILKMRWEQRIQEPMARSIQGAVKKWRAKAAGGFVLILNTRGGSVNETKKVIAILQKLRQTHKLETLVRAGHVCGSGCIPIFLQGETRTAATATLWLFHEVAKKDPKTKKIKKLKTEKTNSLFQQYFIPAGVPQVWLDKLESRIRGVNYWMTGAQLFTTGSNIANRKIGNGRKRNVDE